MCRGVAEVMVWGSGGYECMVGLGGLLGDGNDLGCKGV